MGAKLPGHFRHNVVDLDFPGVFCPTALFIDEPLVFSARNVFAYGRKHE